MVKFTKVIILLIVLSFSQIQFIVSQVPCTTGQETTNCDSNGTTAAGTCDALDTTTPNLKVFTSTPGLEDACVSNAGETTCATAVTGGNMSDVCVYAEGGTQNTLICGDLTSTGVYLTNKISGAVQTTVPAENGTLDCHLGSACPENTCTNNNDFITNVNLCVTPLTTNTFVYFDNAGLGTADPVLDGTAPCTSTALTTANTCAATQCRGTDTTGTYNVCFDIAIHSTYTGTDIDKIVDDSATALTSAMGGDLLCTTKASCEATAGKYVGLRFGYYTCGLFDTSTKLGHKLYLQEYVYTDSNSIGDYFLVQFICQAPIASPPVLAAAETLNGKPLTGGANNWLIGRQTVLDLSSTTTAATSLIVVNTSYDNSNLSGTVATKITTTTATITTRFQKYLVSPFENNTRFHYVLHMLPTQLTGGAESCFDYGADTEAGAFPTSNIVAKLKFFAGELEATNYYNSISESATVGGKLLVKANGTGTWPDINATSTGTPMLMNSNGSGTYILPEELWKCGIGAASCGP